MMNILQRFAYDVQDSEHTRLQKLTAIIVSGSCCVCGVIWTLMYFLIYGLCLTTILPSIFVVIVGAAIVVAHYKKTYQIAVYAQIICIIYVTSAIQWSIGGVFDSGFVMAWAFCGPMTALTFFSVRQSSIWFGLFFINIIITVFFNDYLSAHSLDTTQAIRHLYFIMNIGFSSVVVFIFASFFVSNTLKEEERANSLLLNILPRSIARILKGGAVIIATRHEDVSVLFADVTDFTTYSALSTPEEIVRKLDTIFNRFDKLALKYGLEKIKTIGDAYMVAGGIPDPLTDHRRKMAMMALEMQKEIQLVEREPGVPFAIRIGVHAGPVVAGVIGKSKFAYDLWADAVNVASRMESSGEIGRIQVSNDFADGLKNEFEFEERGEVEIKGKGKMNTYFLTGTRREIVSV